MTSEICKPRDKHPKRCEKKCIISSGEISQILNIVKDEDYRKIHKIFCGLQSQPTTASHSSSGSPSATEEQELESPQQGYPGIRYYPISEGELRSILDMDHIPKNPTSNDVFRANTQILAMILNRDSIDTRSDPEIAQASREKDFKIIRDFISEHPMDGSCPFNKMNHPECLNERDGQYEICIIDHAFEAIRNPAIPGPAKGNSDLFTRPISQDALEEAARRRGVFNLGKRKSSKEHNP